MKNIQAWVNDKPALLALTSLEWAYWAPDIYDYLRAFGDDGRSRKIKEKFPLPPLDEWIAVYENPSVITSLTGILLSMNDLFGKVGNLLEQNRISNSNDPSIREIKKQGLSTLSKLRSHEEADKSTPNNYWLQIAKMRLDSMRGEISGVDDGGLEKVGGFLTLPIVVYAARVLVPSLLLYQRNPQDLFREAKSGKLDSLAKLLVIDKEILRDETIFGFFRDATQPDKELDYNMLTKAFKQTPADLVTLKKVKVAVARFILDISKVMGHRFTINEIRALYDKIEKEREGDNAAIDEDGLYDSEDSFYKAVIRHPGYDSLFLHLSDKKI
jgi:hypothetical protein